MFKVYVDYSSFDCDDCGWVESWDFDCFYDKVEKIFYHDGHLGNGEMSSEMFSFENLEVILSAYKNELMNNGIEIVESKEVSNEVESVVLITVMQNNKERVFEYCTYNYEQYESTEKNNIFEKFFDFVGIKFDVVHGEEDTEIDE